MAEFILSNLLPKVSIDLHEINRYMDIVHGCGENQGELALIFKLRDGSQFKDAAVGSQFFDRPLSTVWLPSSTTALSELPDDTQQSILAHWNTYITPMRYKIGARRRKAEFAQWVPGTWADLDIKPSQSGGFSTAQSLDAFIDTLIEPTLIVDTGSGGRHPYWLLKDPLIDMTKADKLLKEYWRSYMWFKADAVGKKVDLGVFDLARMLRLPGTVRHPKNVKYEVNTSSTMVRIIKADGPRYSFDELRNATKTAFTELKKRETNDKARFERDRMNRIDAMRLIGLKEHVYRDIERVFDEQQDWAPLLTSSGWTLDADQRDHAGSTQARYWVRPGKTSGGSAMTDHGDSRIMWVWSDDVSLDDLFLGPRNGVSHVVSKYRYALVRIFHNDEKALITAIVQGGGSLDLS